MTSFLAKLFRETYGLQKKTGLYSPAANRLDLSQEMPSTILRRGDLLPARKDDTGSESQIYHLLISSERRLTPTKVSSSERYVQMVEERCYTSMSRQEILYSLRRQRHAKRTRMMRDRHVLGESSNFVDYPTGSVRSRHQKLFVVLRVTRSWSDGNVL